MELRKTEYPDTLVITVEAPRIDAAAAIRFKDLMREYCASAPARIILDLAQVDFVDSSGLGAIVASMKQLSEGQVLELATLSPTVEKVFRLTRMDTVFRIHEDAGSALQARH